MKLNASRIYGLIAIELVTGIGQWLISQYMDRVSQSSTSLVMLRYLLIVIFLSSLTYLAYMLLEWYFNRIITKRFVTEYRNLNRAHDDIELLTKYINYRFEKYTTVTIGGDTNYITQIHDNFNQQEVSRLVELRAIYETKGYRA